LGGILFLMLKKGPKAQEGDGHGDAHAPAEKAHA
jgi:hypothetical protein